MSRVTAYFCLGSNIKPEENIRFAVERVQQNFNKVKISNLYKTSAIGFKGDDFLNMAVSVKTRRSLRQLLNYADQLEKEAGRVRVERGRYDSRTLDVDLVMYGDLQGTHKGKHWPSRDIHKDAHVLLPLSEIAGTKKHPILGINFRELWNNFDIGKQKIKRMNVDW